MRADNITAAVVVFDSPSTHLPTDAPCVLNAHMKSADIDRVLTEQPSAMLHADRRNAQLLDTMPVELIYNGAVDAPGGGGPPLRINVALVKEVV